MLDLSIGLDWLAAFSLLCGVEALTALSYVPAWRNPWRRWPHVDWRAEWPWMHPSLWLSGPLWSVLQAINALGGFFLLRLAWHDDGIRSHEAYAASLILWMSALLVWSLWAVPWEMGMVWWTVITWALSSALAIPAAVLAWHAGSTVACVLLGIYAAVLVLFALTNTTGLLFCTTPGAVLHRRFENPLVFLLHGGLWPVLPEQLAWEAPI